MPGKNDDEGFNFDEMEAEESTPAVTAVAAPVRPLSITAPLVS